MARTASALIAQARSWLGCRESNGSHRKIIDTYNSHKPLARGYAVRYTDAWCATFVSACSIKCGMTDIIPTECGCSQMIQLFKKLGEWAENDARRPNPSDVIFYDWQDSGRGDNVGNPDHVGIVEKVSGNNITVIEGNCSNAVKRRTIAINSRYIRGYNVPKYDASAPAAPSGKAVYYIVRKGDTLSGIAKKYSTTVSAIQKLNSQLIKNVNLIRVGWKIRIR